MQQEIINDAKALCQKFIGKVESGRARSKETYAECTALLRKIEAQEHANASDGESVARFGDR